ncbi:MAG TPA: hypothetical protein VFZ65_12020 [Planctomycetota bacterium]|nr:hypothetical protein [Planctomycetota bacterium]
MAPPRSRSSRWPTGLLLLAACGSGGSEQSTTTNHDDTTPPTAGEVFDGIAGDISSQTSSTTIRANWRGFTDDSGSIAEYRWAIGTTPGGTELQDWTSVGTATQASNTALALGVGTTCYAAVRGFDAAGNASAPAVSDGVLISNAPGGGGTATGTLASTVSQWGVTWQFAEPELVGQFANGDWWVIGPVSIVQITPLTHTIGTRTVNGSMINPTSIVDGFHGYDSELFHPFENDRYKASLNVAIGVGASSPLVLQGGTSLISVISYTSETTPANGSHSQLATAAVLTVLPEAPPAGAFRPPYAGTDKTIRHREADLDYTALGSIAAAPGTPAIADVADRFQRVWLDHMSGWTSRYMHPVDNMPDYGRDFCALFGTGALMLQLDLPNEHKRDLLVRLVQIGIDFWGNVQNGGYWEGVVGHGSGRKMPILLAGAVLNDAGMLAVGTTHPSGYFGPGNANNRSQFGEDCQTFYVEQTAPGVYNWGNGGYTSAHLGLPEWGVSHTHAPGSDNSVWLADPYRRCCTACAWPGQTLAARIMGLRTAWNHASYFDYVDRYMQTETPGEWTRSWDPWQAAMWDMHRANF